MREIIIIDDGSEDGAEHVVLKRMRDKLLIAPTRAGIHRYRMCAGLSQGRMAEKLGITQAALSKMESGDLQTRPDLLQKAARVLVESAKPKKVRRG